MGRSRRENFIIFFVFFFFAPWCSWIFNFLMPMPRPQSSLFLFLFQSLLPYTDFLLHSKRKNMLRCCWHASSNFQITSYSTHTRICTYRVLVHKSTISCFRILHTVPYCTILVNDDNREWWDKMWLTGGVIICVTRTEISIREGYKFHQ